MSDASSVSLVGISKRYAGANRPALDNVSLTIEPGAFFSILGPSGCGKTTLLRIIAGFEYPTSGRVLIGGTDVTGLPPRQRDIAMVFQDYALYPHMTVRQNITFNLTNKRVPRKEIDDRLQQVATTLGLTLLLEKLPDKLSGGERQRVALGRAIIRRPRVFLMDEPLSNLDLKLRELMRIELGRIHKELGVTMVFVTHDQSEAMTLSSTMAILEKGEVQQVGSPDLIYSSPANSFVARFIGSPSMNLLSLFVAKDCLVGGNGQSVRLPRPSSANLTDGTMILAGVRPHHFKIAPAGVTGIAVEVELVEHLGRSDFAVCRPRVEGLFESQRTIVVELETGSGISAGASLELTVDRECITCFNARSGAAIPA